MSDIENIKKDIAIITYFLVDLMKKKNIPTTYTHSVHSRKNIHTMKITMIGQDITQKKYIPVFGSHSWLTLSERVSKAMLFFRVFGL